MNNNLFFLLTWLCFGNAYKILVVFPFPGTSHVILGNAYVTLLLQAGHEVTYITPQPMGPRKNLQQIYVKNDIPGIFNISSILNKETDLSDQSMVVDILSNLSEKTLENENVQRMMYDPKEKFDLAIVEWLFNELYSSFSVVFDCPFIWAGSTEPHPFIMSLIDDAPNPAYVTDILSYNIPPLTFYQHLEELWIQIKVYIKRKFFDPQQKLYERLIGPVVAHKGRQLPSYEKVKYNASFIFSNSHYSMGQALRLPQNFKLIGGYHIDSRNIIPLSKELSLFMNNSVNGVIYFSMGSNLKSKDMPNQIKTDLLKMFGSLKQSVVWKFEENLSEVPKNVFVIDWAPQQSILSHPNCKLFISHGGLLSTIETLYFGVPIIGIPMFGDQFINVKRAEVKGFAKKVDLSYTVAEDLRVAIEEMLGDPRYYNTAKELSRIYHDRPVPPGKELVHWVEHVVRTRGAAHLRSPALMVPWYQKMYLNLVFIILVAIFLVIFISKSIIYSIKTRQLLKKKMI